MRAVYLRRGPGRPDLYGRRRERRTRVRLLAWLLVLLAAAAVVGAGSNCGNAPGPEAPGQSGMGESPPPASRRTDPQAASRIALRPEGPLLPAAAVKSPDAVLAVDRIGLGRSSEAIELAVDALLVRRFSAADATLSGLYPRARSVVLLRVWAYNGSEHTISFYPNQGRLTAGEEGASADVIASDDVGDVAWAPGVVRQGFVVFVLRTPPDQVAALQSLEYTVDSAHHYRRPLLRLGTDFSFTIPLPHQASPEAESGD